MGGRAESPLRGSDLKNISPIMADTMSTLQERFATRDRPTRLPLGLTPEKFKGEWVPHRQPIRDTDPDMECEFFETRQVGQCEPFGNRSVGLQVWDSKVWKPYRV